MLAHELPDRPAAMRGQSVPDDQQLARKMTQQMREKLDDLRAADGSWKQPEIEVPPSDSRHHRKCLPREVVLQHRCLSFRCPGACAVRALAQSAFVGEDDGTPFFSGFFLIPGQRFRFHARMLVSSRSRARPTGRWQLHPSRRRIRQACEG